MKGWQFFPQPEPGPVDDAYVQQRWTRPYPSGPLRWLVVAGLGVLTAFAAFSALLLFYSSRTVTDLGAALLLGVLLIGGLGWVTGRVLSTGVWVSDGGVRVVRPLRSRAWRWRDVADVRDAPATVPLLGGLLRTDGQALVLVLRDGSEVVTPVTDHSLDFVGRPEGYTVATEALERWFTETR